MGKGLKGFCLALALLVCTALSAQTRKVTYVYTDPQGTPLAEADASGNITATFDYRPYGSSALGTAPNGPGYTGHVNDSDTGLVYMQARYYDPVVGRFVSVDPVGIEQKADTEHFNRYSYAYNNPNRYTDPDGRCPICIGVILYFTLDYANAPGPHDAPHGMSTDEKIDAASAALPVSKSLSFIKGAINIDRKIGTIRQNAAKGKMGENIVRAQYGNKVAGEQVSFKTSDGTRTRADLVTTNGDVVEVKTGNAVLSPGQAKLQSDINSGNPVTPVGNNAKNAGLPVNQPVQMNSFKCERPDC